MSVEHPGVHPLPRDDLLYLKTLNTSPHWCYPQKGYDEFVLHVGL